MKSKSENIMNPSEYFSKIKSSAKTAVLVSVLKVDRLFGRYLSLIIRNSYTSNLVTDHEAICKEHKISLVKFGK